MQYKLLNFANEVNHYLKGEENMYYSARTIREKENLRKAKPTVEDIEETFQMLRDFRIRIKKEDIPKKNTLAELLQWRQSKIRTFIQG